MRSCGTNFWSRNVVNICIPAALDPSMAPPGKASTHVYYAANEPYDDWARLERGSAAYKALKEERSQASTPARAACLRQTCRGQGERHSPALTPSPPDRPPAAVGGAGAGDPRRPLAGGGSLGGQPAHSRPVPAPAQRLLRPRPASGRVAGRADGHAGAISGGRLHFPRNRRAGGGGGGRHGGGGDAAGAAPRAAAGRAWANVGGVEKEQTTNLVDSTVRGGSALVRRKTLRMFTVHELPSLASGGGMKY